MIVEEITPVTRIHSSKNYLSKIKTTLKMNQPEKRIRLSELGKYDPKSHTGARPVHPKKKPTDARVEELHRKLKEASLE